MDTRAKLYEEIEYLFDLTLQHETAEPWALALKLGEELGEFQQAVLKDEGYLRHKELKEDMWGEAADIVCVLIGYFARRYPECTGQQLTERLYDNICEKGDKYRTILLQNKEQ